MHARHPAAVGLVGLALGLALAASGAAGAVSGVHAPTRAQRAAILRALVKQDGTTAGVTSVYLANADHRLAGVCQRTPDAGKVAFLFRASGRSWRYVLNSQAPNASNRARLTLERACLR
jgi:hypothetical protein